jgi:hypothetical protein
MDDSRTILEQDIGLVSDSGSGLIMGDFSGIDSASDVWKTGRSEGLKRANELDRQFRDNNPEQNGHS